MSGEIQVIDNGLSASTTPQTAFTHTGDNGVQIANSGTVNLFFNAGNGVVYNAANVLSTEYYNLFVVGDEAFTDPFFLIDKERALTIAEGIASDISRQFAALTPDAIAEIKTFPSLFVSENHHYGRTDSEHLAIFGVITDIRIQENGIKVYFQSFCTFPQQRLNDIALRLAIKGNPGFNELNRTHWAIKKIHLVEELKAAGISVLAPT